MEISIENQLGDFSIKLILFFLKRVYVKRHEIYIRVSASGSV